MENIDDKKLYVTLSEYCNAVKDGTHDSPKRVDDGKFLITSKHICDNKIDFSGAYKISVEDYNNINRRSKVDKWDLLMSMIGTVGRLYIVKEEPDYAIKNLALFKNNDEWHAKYLYYYLGSKPVQDYFEAVANGTTQHFVGLGYLRKFKVPKWTDDKLKTVKILDSYDKLIEKNNRKIAILEEQIQELYKEWFVRKRYFFSLEKNNVYKARISDLLVEDFNGGWGEDCKSFNNNFECAVIRGTDIPDIMRGEYQNVPVRFHTENHFNTKKLVNNDIILELSNGNIDNIGRTLLIDSNIINSFKNVMCASFCKALRFKDEDVALSV